MKKRLTVFATALVMATAVLAGGYLSSTYAGGQSCNGKCNRSRNACLATANSTSQAAQCNKAYQGCISSCK